MSAVRILAPMGSRSFFGAERANIGLLFCMQQRGAEVLCLVRHEDWPESAALTAGSLACERAPFPDYPSIRLWRYWPRADGDRARTSLTDRLQVDQHDDAWWQVYAEAAAGRRFRQIRNWR